MIPRTSITVAISAAILTLALSSDARSDEPAKAADAPRYAGRTD